VTLRVRVLAACLAIGAAAFIICGMSGAAAQAATLSVTHPAATAQTAGDGNCGYSDCNQNCSYGNCNNNCGYQNCMENCVHSNCNGNSNSGYVNCPSYLQYLLGGKKCCKPMPTPPPPCPCHTRTPTPSPSMTYTVTPPPTPAPSPTPVVVTTSPTPAVPVVTVSSPVPTGAANTGGGMAGGSNIPLAAGGGAVALVAAPLGLAAFRRWRRTHSS
jgi:hypothetical protein